MARKRKTYIPSNWKQDHSHSDIADAVDVSLVSGYSPRLGNGGIKQ